MSTAATPQRSPPRSPPEHQRVSRRAPPHHTLRCDETLGWLQARERLLEEVGELLVVDRLRAGGRAPRLDAGDVAEVVPALLDPPDAALDELPGAHVLGLLLQPHQ